MTSLPRPANVRSDSATFLGLVALSESRENLDYLANRGLLTLLTSNASSARLWRTSPADSASAPLRIRATALAQGGAVPTPVLHGLGTSSPTDALRTLTEVRSLVAAKRSCHRDRVVPHA
ncbi:hypothetical protein AB0478_47725 [Streptomyces sp. NPDC051917]|uniref:hypothetical protein n=1 Tax=Streptomyces sp. NPDC051917 TaxID=3154754 RepID=UPI003452D344